MAAVLLSLCMAGCAEKGPILLSAAYQPPEGLQTATAGGPVAVNAFRDNRGKPVSVVGSRAIPSGQTDDLVVAGSVSNSVTALMMQALRERGIGATNVTGWDLTSEGMLIYSAPLVLGGEITTLWIDSRASGLATKVTAVVQLRIVAGDTVEKKIIRSIEVSSKLDQEVLYSQERLQTILSEAVSSAIDQIFIDAAMKKRLY